MTDHSIGETRILNGNGTFAVSELLEALHDDDQQVRDEAINSLKLMGELAVPELLASLQTTLHSNDDDLSYMVLQVLAEIGDLRAVPILLTTLRREDNYYGILHETAANALARLGESVVADLVLAFQDEDEEVRSSMAYALGQIGSTSALEALLEALHDTSERVRVMVTYAVGKYDDLRAIEGLLAQLNDESQIVREAAVRTLRELEGPQAIEGLLIALKDESQKVREEAINALEQIGGPYPQAIEGLRMILKDEKEVVSLRRTSAICLYVFGDTQVVEELQCILLDARNSREIRRTAAELFWQFGDERSVNALLETLRNRIEPWYIRKKVVETVGHFGGSHVTEALLKALYDDHLYVRRTVVDVLVRRKDPTALNEMLITLRDVDWFTRLKAARALGYIGGQQAIEDLRLALSDENELVRREAKIALERIENGSNSTYETPYIRTYGEYEFPGEEWP